MLAIHKCEYNMGLIMEKLKETALYVAAMPVLVLNLRKVLCAIF